MKRIGILLPDGVGIRNYMFSSFLKNLMLSEKVEIVLIHSVTEMAISEIENHNKFKFEKHLLPLQKESFKLRFYREFISYARLMFNKNLTNNDSIMTNWNPQKNKISKKIFYFLIESLQYLFIKNYNSILFFENTYNRAVLKESKSYKKFLKEIKVDVIFCTNQRANNSILFIAEANNMGIKTIGAVFSWDNIPKANLSLKTDEYVVWSEHMKEEMNLFYPEIPEDKIKITGTPQFEFYENPDLLQSKTEFCKQFGLDSSKKTICFSGDDTRTSPYDPIYLSDLAEKISNLPKSNQPQILLRRCPVDLSGRFDSIVEKYKDIIKVAAPIWNFDRNNKKKWTLVYPKFEDVELLINTVKHCDVVLNVGSTMAHDFAMFKKPAIYINYDVSNAKNWSVNTIYQFQHFRSMEYLEPVFWLNSKDMILEILNKAFASNENSKQIKDGQKWLDIIATDRENASENIANALIGIHHE
mgnify:CR=1 FL=1